MKKTKLISLLLTVAMIAGLLAVAPLASSAEEGEVIVPAGPTLADDQVAIPAVEMPTDKWTGTSQLPATVITENVYEIKTAQELADLAEYVTKGNTCAGLTFYITADIDLGGKLWTPMGGVGQPNKSASKTFNGALIGSKGDTTGAGGSIAIKNMRVDTATTYAALISVTGEGVTLKNIDLVDSYVRNTISADAGEETWNGAAGFVARIQANKSTFENLSSNGVVVQAVSADVANHLVFAGGLFAVAHGAGGTNIIKNCTFTGKVFNNTTKLVDVETGDIIGYAYKESHTGGIIGRGAQINTITENTVDGAEIYGNGNTAGICGSSNLANQVVTSNTVKNSTIMAASNPTANNNGLGTAGIFGYLNKGGNDISLNTVENCTIVSMFNPVAGIFGSHSSAAGSFTKNTVKNTDLIGSKWVGGIFGYSSRADDVVEENDFSGTISGGNYLGGIMGYSRTSIKNCTVVGEIIGTKGLVGGAIGEWNTAYSANTPVTLENVFVSAEVAVVAPDEDSKAGKYAGGLVGKMTCSEVEANGNTTYAIKDCQFDGTVAAGNYAGTAVGWFTLGKYNNTLTIENFLSTGVAMAAYDKEGLSFGAVGAVAGVNADSTANDEYFGNITLTKVYDLYGAPALPNYVLSDFFPKITVNGEEIVADSLPTAKTLQKFVSAKVEAGTNPFEDTDSVWTKVSGKAPVLAIGALLVGDTLDFSWFKSAEHTQVLTEAGIDAFATFLEMTGGAFAETYFVTAPQAVLDKATAKLGAAYVEGVLYLEGSVETDVRNPKEEEPEDEPGTEKEPEKKEDPKNGGEKAPESGKKGEKKGCGSSIALCGVALVSALGLGVTAVVRKKDEQ